VRDLLYSVCESIIRIRPTAMKNSGVTEISRWETDFEGDMKYNYCMRLDMSGFVRIEYSYCMFVYMWGLLRSSTKVSGRSYHF
jgi:hypothetical protein